MSAAKQGAKIFNIPAGTAFADRLAAQLIAETEGRPEALAAYCIILPTRRACRVLREAFVQLREGEALLLPRMHAVGDIDEEELSLSMAEGPELLDIPPALTPLKRQVLLARTIMAIPDYAKGFDQALLLANALGSLMDQVYTEGLKLEKLPSLVDEATLSEHWQVTLKFMEILSRQWPAILEEMGVIDAADRRDRLLRSLAAHWAKTPPNGPIIAAGSTGSVPAVRELLRVIAALPNGRIVLPGLDQDMDAESWKHLSESHPQFLLRNLLATLETGRGDVALWPGVDNARTLPRRVLAAEIMRPSATTQEWTETLPTSKPLQQSIKAATQSLRLLTCSNEREEAAAIAVLLRETLATPGRTAALITPRRSLARRVASACRRWEIALDDSAGRTLDQAPAGSFLMLSVQACADNFTPVSLLALLKHPLSGTRNVQALDKALRGPKPAPGLEGIKTHAMDGDSEKIMRVIEPHFSQFMNGSAAANPRKFSEILAAHLELAENLSIPGLLWQGQEGEEATRFLATLQGLGADFPDMDLKTYESVLGDLLRTVTVRPAWGTHPRLHILGLPEARMMDADLVILAGLNEGSWPPDPGHDPWISRPMREDFGLPGPERKIGLTAHDFAQGFCSNNVVLTRSLRQDGGPSVPARWLQRLSAVLEAAGIDEDRLLDTAAAKWAAELDAPANFAPLKRPKPTPPVSARPRKISVTHVEKWQKDPYGVYAKYVLELRKMDQLEKPVDDAEKGTLLHKIMKRFVDDIPGPLPADAEKSLIKIAADELAARHDDPAVWSFWQRRFEKTANWIVQHERGWRETATPRKTETDGEIPFAAAGGEFILTARADRIDAVPGGGAAIDYKSGNPGSAKALRTGKLPQLPLEGLILARGGFKEVGGLKPVSLQYWKLSGGIKPDDEPIVADGNLDNLIANAESGLLALINIFDNEATPYYSLPRPDEAPRFNDYKHLARIAEWAALGDDDSEAA